jgi:hypothetical protein
MLRRKIIEDYFHFGHALFAFIKFSNLNTPGPLINKNASYVCPAACIQGPVRAARHPSSFFILKNDYTQ